MKINNRFVSTLLTIFMVIAYSAMSTVPAFADEGTPPEGTSSSDVQPEVDPLLPVDSVPSETVELPLVDVVAQLPEGTNVVILDESNNSVPLATQEAAQTLENGDPMWCPTGVSPKPGVGGCSPAFDRFGSLGDTAGTGSLIDWLITNQQNKAGTIWVEDDYDNSANETAADIIFSGADYTTMDNFALTVQGGWEGTIGSVALHTADPYSYFNKTLIIGGWTGAITLNNIVLGGFTTNSAVDDTYGLLATTKGNIVLNNVTVQNLDDTDNDTQYGLFGAYLYNDGTGTVTINNSDFINNDGNGLFVLSTGAITTNGLVASFNSGYGAWLANDYMVQGKPVTLKGFKQFNNNGADGLLVSSHGLITLSNIVANSNVGDGIFLDNRSSTANSGITLSGTNYTMNNGGDGMAVYSHGAITANNLNASGNGGAGAWLDNCDYNGSECDAILAKPVKLTGVNVFNGNGTTNEGGLGIQSIGAISVNNLTASDNLGDGAYIDNQWENFNGVLSTGTWTLTGYGVFQNNSGNGLLGFSFGNAVLSNIDASYNNEDGLHMEVYKITGGSGITLNGINQFSDNVEDGLSLFAEGQITVNNVTANRNGVEGAYLGNLYDPIKPFNITMKGTNTFKDNGEDGLFVESFGSILVNNLTAGGNGAGAVNGSGAILDNCVWDGVSACYTATPKAVTVTGYLNVSNNFNIGLHVDSTGAVTLNNIMAEWNGLEGVEIWNNAVSIQAQLVTLKGSNTFNSNGSNGLEVLSYGAITANNITAFGNGGSGAALVNTGGVTPKNITLTGVNAFVGNYEDGLFFNASGSVVLSRVNADGNDWDIPDIYTGNGITGTAGGSITLSCIYATNQANGAGFNLSAFTTIVIKGLYEGFNNLSSTATGTLVTITKPCALP